MYDDSYNRTLAPSPQFTWKNSQILTGAIEVMNWYNYSVASQKYLPFNLTRIINNSSYDITFYPNQNMGATDGILIPKGTIFTVDRSSIPALSSFIVKNEGASTITANQIIVTNSREGQTANSIVQRLYDRLNRSSSV